MSQSSRHPLVALCVFVAAVLVFGAGLAPWLFKAGHLAAESIEEFRLKETPPFGYLHKVATESGFTRYFNRAVLLASLACLWPFGRRLGMRGRDFFPGTRARMGADLAVGFLLSAGILLALGWALVQSGAYEMRDEIKWGSTIQRAVTTAAGVSLLEEFLFRGALFALLLRVMRPVPALWGLSLFFAAVHFLKPPESMDFPPESVGWASGFHVLGGILRHFGDPIFLAAEFATLLAVGLVLGWTRLRTSALWLPIGLHGGWVFGIFFFRGLARGSRATRDGDALPWIGDNLKTGLAPLAAIAVTAVLLALWMRSRASRLEPSNGDDA